MKNIKLLLIALVMMSLGVTSVDAKLYTAAEIPPNSYVIGEDIFTVRKEVGISDIMLAAQAIIAEDNSDMLIYYKTPAGTWINGATGESLTPPETFEIEYIDDVKADDRWKIVYELKGGNADNNPSYYYTSGENVTLINPLRKGYVFTGWTGSNGDKPERDYVIKTGTEGHLAFIANWVMLGDANLDGQTNVMDTLRIAKIVAGSVKPTEEEKLAADVDGDGVIDRIDVLIMAHNIAGWEEFSNLPIASGDKYNITYNLDGGTIDVDNKLDVYATELLQYADFAKITNPTKDGYTFIGWTGSNGNQKQINVSIKEGTTGDLTYTANWAIEGDANGDGVVNVLDVLRIANYLTGKIDLTEQELAIADFNCDGDVDYLDTTCLSYFIANGKKIDNIGTKYSITLEANGGTFDEEFPYYAYTTELLSKMPTIELPNPTKEGSVFIGWIGSNGDIPQKDVVIPKDSAGDLSYAAQYVMIGDADLSGKIDSRDLLRIAKIAAGVIEEITDNELIAADVDADGKVTVFDNLILAKKLAGWSRFENLPIDVGEKYTITYNLNGGLGYSLFKEYAPLLLDDEEFATLQKPTKESYEFVGWTGSNGDVPQKVVVIPEGTTGDLEYTAHWRLIPDVNKDGDVNIADVLRLSKYLGDWNVDISLTAADLNEDGSVDPIDLRLLARYVGGWYTEDQLPLKVDKYHIAYDLDGGVLADKEADLVDNNGNPVVRYYEVYAVDSNGDIVFLETPKVEKEGYAFAGWTGSNGDVPQTVIKLPEGTAGNLNLKANWKNVGDVDSDGSLTMKDVLLLAQYVSGYDVELDLNVADIDDDGVIDYIDVNTLAAYHSDWYNVLPVKHAAKYNVSWNANGGTLIEGQNMLQYEKYAVSDNGKIIFLNAPRYEREGYIFVGWTGSNGDTPELEIDATKLKEGYLKFMANWALVGDVSQDGKVNVGDVVAASRYVAGLKQFTQDQIIAADVDSDGDVDNIDIFVLSGHVAKWQDYATLPVDAGDEYVIEYELDEGYFTGVAKTRYATNLLTDDVFNKLDVPRRDGYEFIGWTGSNGNTPQIEVTIPASAAEDLYYIANWQEITQ